MTTLTITANHNYTADLLALDITDFVFNTPGPGSTVATFAGTQFGGNPIPDSLHITGDAFRNTVSVSVSGVFSAAGWTFSSWGGLDGVALFGSSGADTITGSSQADSISGRDGIDALSGGEGNDLFFYESPTEIAAGESVDGGSGTDRIFVFFGGSFDFSGATLTRIEQLFFGSTDAMTVTLAGDQIGAGAITTVADGSGTSGAQSLIVNGSVVDLSAVTFVAWSDGTDTITINGTDPTLNLLTGSSRNDTINGGGSPLVVMRGGGGADVLNGGDGNDVFDYAAAGEVVFGEIISGGGGTDTIRLANAGGTDFSLATITGVEEVDFSGGAPTATFSGTQVGAGAIASVSGNAGGTDALVVFGSAVDLSGVTFADWTNGTDLILIIGTAGNDTLIGSGQNDSIASEQGADILTGGGGDDVLRGGAGADADTFVFNFTLGDATISFGSTPGDYDLNDNGVSQSEFAQFAQAYRAWLKVNAPADFGYDLPQPDPLTSASDPDAVEGAVSSVLLTNNKIRYWEDTIKTGNPAITASDGHDRIIQFQSVDKIQLNGLASLDTLAKFDALFDLASVDTNGDGAMDSVLSWGGGMGSITIRDATWADIGAFYDASIFGI